MSNIINAGQFARLQANSLRRGSLTEKKPIRYGRVLRVVMDSTDPLWKDLGCDQALYGVFYQEIYNDQSADVNGFSNFAYCRHANIRRIPIKNEIVSLVTEPDAEASYSAGFLVEKVYWDSVVPVWNSPHLNPFPDTLEFPGSPVDVGKNFEETGKIYPLQLCEGDVSIEGRHGQSIRFGGTSCEGDFSVLTNEKNNGSPYILIRNGQTDPANLGEGYIFADESGSVYSLNENVNLDKSSLYLTSDHQVPLEQASQKRLAWKDGKGPDEASAYVGAEILANSDRIFINAKKDDIELSAKGSVGINSDTAIGIDAVDYIGFDAKKILLGERAVKNMDNSDNSEPVLKGATTVAWIIKLCDQLDSLLTSLGDKSAGDNKLWKNGIIAKSKIVQPSIASLKNQLTNLYSKKVFVE